MHLCRAGDAGFRRFKDVQDLLAVHGRVLPQEALEGFPLFEVIEQDAHRDARAGEDRGSTLNLVRPRDRWRVMPRVAHEHIVTYAPVGQPVLKDSSRFDLLRPVPVAVPVAVQGPPPRDSRSRDPRNANRMQRGWDSNPR